MLSKLLYLPYLWLSFLHLEASTPIGLIASTPCPLLTGYVYPARYNKKLDRSRANNQALLNFLSSSPTPYHLIKMVCPISITKFVGTISLGLLTVSCHQVFRLLSQIHHAVPAYSFPPLLVTVFFALPLSSSNIALGPGHLIYRLHHHPPIPRPPSHRLLRLPHSRPDSDGSDTPRVDLCIHLLPIPHYMLQSGLRPRQAPVSAVDRLDGLPRRPGSRVLLQSIGEVSKVPKLQQCIEIVCHGG